jgi:hypothetical protein
VLLMPVEEEGERPPPMTRRSMAMSSSSCGTSGWKRQGRLAEQTGYAAASLPSVASRWRPSSASRAQPDPHRSGAAN